MMQSEEAIDRVLYSDCVLMRQRDSEAIDSDDGGGGDVVARQSICIATRYLGCWKAL